MMGKRKISKAEIGHDLGHCTSELDFAVELSYVPNKRIYAIEHPRFDFAAERCSKSRQHRSVLRTSPKIPFLIAEFSSADLSRAATNEAICPVQNIFICEQSIYIKFRINKSWREALRIEAEQIPVENGCACGG